MGVDLILRGELYEELHELSHGRSDSFSEYQHSHLYIKHKLSELPGSSDETLHYFNDWDLHDDVCGICGDTEKNEDLVLCERQNCAGAFHESCLQKHDPPIIPPSGNVPWNSGCPKCLFSKKGRKGLFVTPTNKYELNRHTRVARNATEMNKKILEFKEMIVADQSDGDEEDEMDDDDDQDGIIPKQARAYKDSKVCTPCPHADIVKKYAEKLGFKRAYILHSLITGLALEDDYEAERLIRFAIEKEEYDSVPEDDLQQLQKCITEAFKHELKGSELDISRHAMTPIDTFNELKDSGNKNVFKVNIDQKKWPAGTLTLTGNITSASKKSSKLPQYVQLSWPAGSNKSCRAYRRWGADRFLRLKYNGNERKMIDALATPGKKLEVAGRTWQFLYAKSLDTTLIFFAVDGVGIREPVDISDFLEWAIPANEYNNNLACSKFVSRFDMVFSDTDCGPILDPSEAVEIDDDIVESRTDGNGFIKLSFAEEILEMLCLAGAKNLERPPSVFQGRWAGVKGTWTSIPDEKWDALVGVDNSSKKMAYRKSMKKFTIERPDDFQKHFEVLNYTKTQKKCGRLNRDVIPLLESRGMTYPIFKDLLKDQVNSTYSMLSDFNLALKNLAHGGVEDRFKQKLMAGRSINDPGLDKDKSAIIKSKLADVYEFRIEVPKSYRCMIIPDPFGGKFLFVSVDLLMIGGCIESYGCVYHHYDNNYHVSNMSSLVLNEGEVYLNATMKIDESLEDGQSRKKRIGVLTGKIVLWYGLYLIC